MARGDVLLVGLPPSDKREQSGRRPAVAVQTDVEGEPMLIVAQVTSNLKALRFQHSIKIEPSEANGLTLPSVVMVFQLRSIDKNRILSNLGRLSVEDLEKVDTEIWRMLKS